jgi:hypothetical protein
LALEKHHLSARRDYYQNKWKLEATRSKRSYAVKKDRKGTPNDSLPIPVKEHHHQIHAATPPQLHTGLGSHLDDLYSDCDDVTIPSLKAETSGGSLRLGLTTSDMKIDEIIRLNAEAIAKSRAKEPVDKFFVPIEIPKGRQKQEKLKSKSLLTPINSAKLNKTTSASIKERYSVNPHNSRHLDMKLDIVAVIVPSVLD